MDRGGTNRLFVEEWGLPPAGFQHYPEEKEIDEKSLTERQYGQSYCDWGEP